MLRVTGEVVRYEQRPWAMEGRTGIAKVARVIVGRADFVDVHVPDEAIPPREGDKVDWAVLLSQPGGKARLTLRGNFADLVPEAARPAPVAAVK